MKTGTAHLPLHGGHCPKWLFPRMRDMSREVSKIIVEEYGSEELLRRLSDPYWFQAFGCVLGFDWHSSGVTTTVCGALKEAINSSDLGIAVCGGKGAASRKTPGEILTKGEMLGLSSVKIDSLTYASRMAAKVDSTCIQDGYQLYHHVFLLTEHGVWGVVQQGMNDNNNYARRYHWLSENVSDFLEEPELIAGKKEDNVLNMVAKESKEAQSASVDCVNDMKFLEMPQHHEVRDLTPRTIAALQQAHEIAPENYEELIAIRGIGPKAVRALALTSQLIYGAPLSWEDPVRFSFAHGGKDGHPYKINPEHYDKTIEILRTAIDSAKIGDNDRMRAIRKLNEFLN